MKLSKETVKLIIELKNKGLSSRKIAEILNVGKTTVNDNYSKYFTSVGYTNSKPRVLVFDLETAPSVVATFGRFNVNISHDNVLEEGGQIISAAWKWLGTDTVHTSCMTEDEAVLRDDKRVVEDLWLAFEESDIVVAHNCVHESTPVLTQSLDWVPVGQLKPGDKIVGFEEKKDPHDKCRDSTGKWNGVGKERSVIGSVVTSNTIVEKPCVKVTLSNGDEIITTKDHYWLGMAKSDRNMRWYKSEDLKQGYRFIKYFNVWEEDNSYEAGWLAGFVAGEGCLKHRNGRPDAIDFNQRPGKTFNQALEFSSKIGIPLCNPRKQRPTGIGKQDTLVAGWSGGKFKTVEYLGRLKIHRLMDKINWDNFGSMKAPNCEVNSVVSVEDVGLQKVAVLSTTSKTFFAAGYAMHNCNGFDKKVFNARLAINDLPPHKTVKFIDTLQIAKSMKFNSNKLDSLCDYFGLDRKIQTGGIKLWIDCMNGCPVALAKMQEYNAADVEILSQLYYKLQPFNTSTPNLGMYYNDGQTHCPACGSTALEATGNTMNTNLQKFQEVVCKDCGHRSKHRKSISTKQHKNLQLSSK